MGANHNSHYSVLLSNFMPGSLAGMTAVFLTYPFEVARTRLAIQTTGKVYHGLVHTFVSLSQQEGLRGLFRGGFPTVLGIGVYSGVSFCIYFSSKDVIGHAGATQHFYFGAIAGLIGQLSAYPLEIVRKRMMAHGFIERVSAFKSVQEGVQLSRARDYFFYILKTEGTRGLFKGFSMNLIKSPIASGIVHTVNEAMNKVVGEYLIP